MDNVDVQTIKIDEYIDGGWNEYNQIISDHRPVAVKFDFNFNFTGDINDDGIYNIMDVVLLVNIILDR